MKRSSVSDALRLAKQVSRKGYAWGGVADMPSMEDPSEWLEMGGAKPVSPSVDQQLGLHRDFTQSFLQPLTGQPGGIPSSTSVSSDVPKFVQNNRVSQLQESAQRIKSGEGSASEHAELVNQFKPVSSYAAPVAPASQEQMQSALSQDKVGKLGAPRDLPEGYPAAVRLDIPAYQKNNTWVVSVHDPKTDYSAGKVIGYDSVAHLDSPTFGVQPKGAINIASGKPKSTIATVQGGWKPTTPDAAYALAKNIHNDPAWTQVGMDPERHAYFYDRSSMRPVVSAEEALHIGPLVYAKNPIYGNPNNYPFANGGMARKRYADGGSPIDIDPLTGLPRRQIDQGGGSFVSSPNIGQVDAPPTAMPSTSTATSPSVSASPTTSLGVANQLSNPDLAATLAALQAEEEAQAQTQQDVADPPGVAASPNNVADFSQLDFVGNTSAQNAANVGSQVGAQVGAALSAAQPSSVENVTTDPTGVAIANTPEGVAALESQQNAQEAAAAIAAQNAVAAPQATTPGVQTPSFAAPPAFATPAQLQDNPDITGALADSISNATYGDLQAQNDQVNALNDAIGQSFDAFSIGSNFGTPDESAPSDTSSADSSSSDGSDGGGGGGGYYGGGGGQGDCGACANATSGGGSSYINGTYFSTVYNDQGNTNGSVSSNASSDSDWNSSAGVGPGNSGQIVIYVNGTKYNYGYTGGVQSLTI